MFGSHFLLDKKEWFYSMISEVSSNPDMPESSAWNLKFLVSSVRWEGFIQGLFIGILEPAGCSPGDEQL